MSRTTAIMQSVNGDLRTLGGFSMGDDGFDSDRPDGWYAVTQAEHGIERPVAQWGDPDWFWDGPYTSLADVLIAREH